MTNESEYILEENLVHQRVDLGYKKGVIKDQVDLIANLKSQLETHNGCYLPGAPISGPQNWRIKGMNTTYKE